MNSFKPGRRTLLSGSAALALIGPSALAQSDTHVTIEVEVPVGVGPIFLTGNLPTLGPWKADALKMSPVPGSQTRHSARLQVPMGTVLEYKFTLGTWAREGVGPSGTVLPNFTHKVTGEARLVQTLTDFKKDVSVYMQDVAGSGVLGTLIYWPDQTGAGLEAKRHVSIWLPPEYDPKGPVRHPVIYAHDGQNLFDPRIANTGTDWGLDEAVGRLKTEHGGISPIIVGIWSTDLRRLEYAPNAVLQQLGPDVRDAVFKEFGGNVGFADHYIRFLADDLKPRIDQQFRTNPDRSATFLMGSSMGGLISLYGVCERPDVFSAAACLSMHWPVAINPDRIFTHAETWRPEITAAFTRYLNLRKPNPAKTRLWIDHGTEALDGLYGPYSEALLPVFLKAGFNDPKALTFRIYPGTSHNEAAWRARATDPLRFLLT